LNKILVYYEEYITGKDDLKEVEDKLYDYEDNRALILIIKDIFISLRLKIDNRLNDSKYLDRNGKYGELERLL